VFPSKRARILSMIKLRNWILLVSLGICAQAQWLGYPAPGVPRTPDGKVDLTAKAPRVNGKPDLSGVWHVQTLSLEEGKRLFGEHINDNSVPGMEITTISKYAVNLFLDMKPEEIPMRPEAAAIQKKRMESGEDPGLTCLPIGIPLSTLLSEVHKIVQTPQLIVILLELDGARQIYLDGRKLEADPNPSWLGHSVGRWEGDTLVVETNGFNDKTWLDIVGHPHSERMQLTERYHRRDFGHLDMEITVDDPVMYTRPFSVKITHELQPDTDILEYYCAENEKDEKHARPGSDDKF